MVERISAPQKPENVRVQEHKASTAALLTEKGRSLYALMCRQWLPAVGHASIRMLEGIFAEVLGRKEYTYKKGEGYPRVRILGNGVIIVPLEELYGSTKVRENVEAMRKGMQAMIEEYGMEEVKRPDSKVSKATSAQKAPAAKKRKRAVPGKPVD